MSAKSLLRAGLASPRTLKSPSRQKSILKRPAPLALSSQSPFPFAASATVVVSPTSPHVRFPSSANLTSTFSTHSPNSYDRGTISVSPNPLELPTWGARIYSPGVDKFANASSAEPSPVEDLTPKFKTFTPPTLELGSPTLEIFPNSPVVDSKPTTRAGLRFQAIAANPAIRPVNKLGDALKLFPRSPYPSAPTSPVSKMDKENSAEGGRRNSVGSNTSRLSRAVSEGSAKTKKVPPAITVIKRPSEIRMHVQSPLAQEFLSPVEESPQMTATAANVRHPVSLTQAFWQSMSLDETVDETSPYLTTEDPVASGLLSPGMISPMVFATKEGVLWSPPRKDSLKKDDAPIRVLSPSPEDPFAAFPSFAAALSLESGAGESMITYPPPAVTVESAVERR